MGKMLLAMAALAALQHAAAAPIEGKAMLGGKPLAVTHVAAQLHDNAEGIRARTLIVVVADRPIPPGALDGLGDPVASQLALAGKLRGLLFRIDPTKPHEASLVVLDQPEVGRGLASLVIGSAEIPAVTALKIGVDKVSVNLVRPAGDTQAIPLSFALKLDSPLTREPAVTADLKGEALRASPQYKAALAYLDAIQKGDEAAMKRLSSRSLNERMATLSSAAPAGAMVERLKGAGATMKTQLAKVQRMVERGSRATLIVDERARITMVKEDGAWKSGD